MVAVVLCSPSWKGSDLQKYLTELIDRLIHYNISTVTICSIRREGFDRASVEELFGVVPDHQQGDQAATTAPEFPITHAGDMAGLLQQLFRERGRELLASIMVGLSITICFEGVLRHLTEGEGVMDEVIIFAENSAQTAIEVTYAARRVFRDLTFILDFLPRFES